MSALSGSSGVSILFITKPFFSASSMILSTIAPPIPRSYFSFLSLSVIFNGKSDAVDDVPFVAFGVLFGKPASFAV